jgi:hypothetical protein
VPTKNLQERHEISTNAEVEKTYPEVVMRGAFVVQLRKASQSMAGQIEGSVEEVDTGKQSQFRSENELVGFLRQRFAEMQSSSRQGGDK